MNSFPETMGKINLYFKIINVIHFIMLTQFIMMTETSHAIAGNGGISNIFSGKYIRSNLIKY